MAYVITSKEQYRDLMIEYYGENPNQPGTWKRYTKTVHPKTLDGHDFMEVNEAMVNWLTLYPTYEEMPSGL